ncbi:MAG: hypothetical protein ACR2HJ_12430 [Fimbriimonadales bacterium]
MKLHPHGSTESAAYAIDAGQQVGYSRVRSLPHASLWTGKPDSWLDLLPTRYIFVSYATGVHEGQQVGYVNHISTGDTVAFLCRGTPESLVSLNPKGAAESFALGVHEGRQVGGAVVAGVTRAGMWAGSADTWIDLHPLGSVGSMAFGIYKGQQVGHSTLFTNADSSSHAGLWTGTAASWVDLHPAAAVDSSAVAVHQGQQVGMAFVNGKRHASFWTGTADSWVDLNPRGASASDCLGVHRGMQVGWAQRYGRTHATLWTGMADSSVDLHIFLASNYTNSRAHGIWEDNEGAVYIVGEGFNSVAGRYEALMWARRKPGRR